MRKKILPGLNVLTYIYALSVCFYLLSLALFYNVIVIAGHRADFYLSGLVRLGLIIVPVYLFFRLKRLGLSAWFLAVYFHSFFLLNNFLRFMEYIGASHALVRIAGLYSPAADSFKQMLIVGLNSLLNIGILVYLFKVKKYFF